MCSVLISFATRSRASWRMKSNDQGLRAARNQSRTQEKLMPNSHPVRQKLTSKSQRAVRMKVKRAAHKAHFENEPWYAAVAGRMSAQRMSASKG
jgi:hypothetical protein